MCLWLEVQLVDNKPLNKASVFMTRGSTSGQKNPLIRQVWLQLEVLLVDNKPLNKTIVSTNRGSTSGKQTPYKGKCDYN